MFILHSLSSFAPARLAWYKFESGPEAPSVAAEQGLDDKPDKQQEGNVEIDKTEEKIIRDAVTEAIIAQGDKSYKILLSPVEAGLESDDALKAALKAGTVDGVYYSNGKLNPSRVWVPATVKNRLRQQEKLWKSQDQMKKERDYGVTDLSHFEAEEAHATDLRAKLSGPRMKSAQQRADEREIRSLERVLRRGEAKKKKGPKTKKGSEKTVDPREEVNSTPIKSSPEAKPILEPETVTPPEPVPKTKAEPVPVAETDPETVAVTPPSAPSTPEPEVEIETKSEPNTENPEDTQEDPKPLEPEKAPIPEVKPEEPSMPILGSSEANEEPEYGYFDGMDLNINQQTLLIDYAKENQLTGPNGELTREEQRVIVKALSGFVINESLLNAEENPAVLSMVQEALVNHRSNKGLSFPDEPQAASSEPAAAEEPNAGAPEVQKDKPELETKEDIPVVEPTIAPQIQPEEPPAEPEQMPEPVITTEPEPEAVPEPAVNPTPSPEVTLQNSTPSPQEPSPLSEQEQDEVNLKLGLAKYQTLEELQKEYARMELPLDEKTIEAWKELDAERKELVAKKRAQRLLKEIGYIKPTPEAVAILKEAMGTQTIIASPQPEKAQATQEDFENLPYEDQIESIFAQGIYLGDVTEKINLRPPGFQRGVWTDVINGLSQRGVHFPPNQSWEDSRDIIVKKMKKFGLEERRKVKVFFNEKFPPLGETIEENEIDPTWDPMIRAIFTQILSTGKEIPTQLALSFMKAYQGIDPERDLKIEPSMDANKFKLTTAVALFNELMGEKVSSVNSNQLIADLIRWQDTQINAYQRKLEKSPTGHYRQTLSALAFAANLAEGKKTEPTLTQSPENSTPPQSPEPEFKPEDQLAFAEQVGNGNNKHVEQKEEPVEQKEEPVVRTNEGKKAAPENSKPKITPPEEKEQEPLFNERKGSDRLELGGDEEGNPLR